MNWSWMVGMCTAPRGEIDLLTSTVDSVWWAGWQNNFRLYAEPGTLLTQQVVERTSITRWHWRHGVVGNFFAGIFHMAAQTPVDAVLLCEDDVYFPVGLRDYLEKTIVLGPTRMYLLYTPPHDHQRNEYTIGWRGFRDPNGFAGALGIVVSWPLLLSLAAWGRQLEYDADTRHIDTRVGKWLYHEGGTVFMHHPSLAQHTGAAHSTLYPAEPGRQAIAAIRDCRELRLDPGVIRAVLAAPTREHLP